jgi:DNA-binding CsgD family transcriptional regulator
MFNRNDAHWLSQAVQKLYEARTPAAFARATTEALDQRFELVATACEEIGNGFSTYRLHHLRSSSPAPPDACARMHDNPLTPLVTDRLNRLPLHLRGQATLTIWERTDHFNGIAKPMGWNDQFVIRGQTTPSLVVVGAYSDRVFTSLESSLMQMLEEHVSACWKRVRSTDATRDHLDSPRISLCGQFKPLYLSQTHRLILRGYFPRWNDPANLPPEINLWIRKSIQCLNDRPPSPLRTFTIESARGRLFIRCFFSGTDHSVQLAMTEVPAAPDYFGLVRWGLTPRQCEVVHWIAQGKRDSEISSIIACAPSTVSKHVEHILAKLGAETRTGCVANARDLLLPAQR